MSPVSRARWNLLVAEFAHHLPFTVVGSLIAMAGVWWFGTQHLGNGHGDRLLEQARASFHLFHPLHAGSTPSRRTDTRRYYIQDGKIRCTDFIFFFYLTEVLPGDGGLIVLPGSHKSVFERPANMFYQDQYDNEDYVAEGVPPGVHNFTPAAGDVVIISELLIHGALSWKPRDRDRRFMIMRYGVQHMVTGSIRPFPEEIRARLSPETLELIEVAPHNHTKEIVKQRAAPS